MLQENVTVSYGIYLWEMLLGNMFFDIKSVIQLTLKVYFILMEVQMWVVKIRLFFVWEDLQVTTLALSPVCLIPDRVLSSKKGLASRPQDILLKRVHFNIYFCQLLIDNL